MQHHHLRALDTNTIPSESSSFVWQRPSRTSTSAGATFTGDPDFYVFPNPHFLSRFYKVSSHISGLTHLDTDLYNRCYLPSRPHEYIDSKRDVSWVHIKIEKADYRTEDAPCIRQAAINANCYQRDTNGSFSGLERYKDHFDEQQHCFCEKYPFFESALGCQKCLEMHGGISGYHWFPESYVNAAANAYCAQDPPTQEFYKFVQSWKATAAEANVPSTTAKDVLGTQTAASLYYTAGAVASSKKNGSPRSPRSPPKIGLELGICGWIVLALLVILGV
ncbi:hypothetical protein B0J11DRAFT_584174 [Dendryphion nanum]|uniref:Uncharacterized protein n=1 Tax=Dendryphion nanum TaxID=256645 RepID=A0A9P9DB63_9PLEO|nr:hypothetical protein B0J11DRAFT_584174 [Dendryphion nanum]